MSSRTRTKIALGEMLGGKQLEPQVVLAFFAGELPGYENLECYIYRLKPKPPDRPRETPSYLWKMQTPFSLEDIKRRFGGGVFKCIANSLTEKDPVTTHRLNKANFLFEIDGPPIFAPAAEVVAPAPPAVGPAQPPAAAGARGFAIGGMQLTDLKILKELLSPSVAANIQNPGAMELSAFLKGVEFARGLERGSETTELDIVKTIVEMLTKGGAPAPAADNGFIVSPGAEAPAAPQPKEELKMTLDTLLNFLMDSYEEGRTAEETAAQVLAMVPAAYVGQLLGYPDPQVVATLKGWMGGYDFFNENAAEKEAWLAEVVAAVRAGKNRA